MAFVNDLLKDDEIREYKISDYNIIEPTESLESAVKKLKKQKR